MTHERDQKSLWAVNLGLGVNILLSILKTIFGVLGHSPALLAEGINSTSDVAYYVVANIFVRLAKKPAGVLLNNTTAKENDNTNGYDWKALHKGGVLTIRRTNARQITILR